MESVKRRAEQMIEDRKAKGVNISTVLVPLTQTTRQDGVIQKIEIPSDTLWTGEEFTENLNEEDLAGPQSDVGKALAKITMKEVSVKDFCKLVDKAKCPVCRAKSKDILIQAKCDVFPEGGLRCKVCGHAVPEAETFEEMFANFNKKV